MKEQHQHSLQTKKLGMILSFSLKAKAMYARLNISIQKKDGKMFWGAHDANKNLVFSTEMRGILGVDCIYQ